MRKVIFQINISLDGFTSGPNGELDWAIVDQEQWKDLFGMYDRLDTVLLGRLNYEGFHGYWPAVANDPSASVTDRAFSRWMDAAPKVVFSHTLKHTDWKNSRLAEGDVASEIARLKQQQGKDMLVMNSTTLAHSLLEHDLIDEFWLAVNPVVIGNGVPLFQDPQPQLTLKLLEAKSYTNGPIFLRYERVREAK
jgi:dihydrofolate reductase